MVIIVVGGNSDQVITRHKACNISKPGANVIGIVGNICCVSVTGSGIDDIDSPGAGYAPANRIVGTILAM